VYEFSSALLAQPAYYVEPGPCNSTVSVCLSVLLQQWSCSFDTVQSPAAGLQLHRVAAQRCAAYMRAVPSLQPRDVAEHKLFIIPLISTKIFTSQILMCASNVRLNMNCSHLGEHLSVMRCTLACYYIDKKILTHSLPLRFTCVNNGAL